MSRQTAEPARTRNRKERPDPARARPRVAPGRPLAAAWWQLPVLAFYLWTIVSVSTHHEMWRDEVRAFSLALDGPNLFAMLPGLRGEGHPFLWYVLLRLVHMVVRSPLALPMSSIAVAAAAAWVFVRHAPFPPPHRALFLFGVLPAFEYSVMCRNYGLGMLMLFLLCVTYERRFQRPVLHGALLFVLASTSAHAAILAGAFAAVWACEGWVIRPSPCPPERRAGHALGIGLALLGLALCAVLAFPATGSSVTRMRHAGRGALASAALSTLLRPGERVQEIVTGGLPLVLAGLESPGGHVVVEVAATLLLVLVGIRLRRHLDLLAAFVLSVLAFGCFFRIVYAGYLRHVGLLFVMIVGLDWIARRREDAAAARAWERVALGAALLAVMAIHTWQGFRSLRRDDTHALSSSKAFAEFVHASPGYRDAIVVVEPDFLLESLPYYMNNRLYSVEEGGFRRWTHFSRSLHDTLSLGQLMDTAESVGRRERATVLLALGHREMLSDSAGSLSYRYTSRFTWTPEERQRLVTEATPVGAFMHSDGIENYVVFQLRPPGARAPGPAR